MPRPIEALVHSDALAHNLAQARAAAPDARLWAVVKANAYGHGIERTYEGLRGADGFALLDLAEAERVRALGWRGPILLLEGVFEPRDLELCSRLNLWHVVHCSQQIDWLAAHKTQAPHRVFLKLNSGMNRLGFRADLFRSAWVRLDALPQVDEISLMTHFADADADMDVDADVGEGADGEAPAQTSSQAASGRRGVRRQLAAFDAATRDLPGERSLSNSAAILRHRGLRSDWVRAGIMVYGSAPDFPQHDIGHWGLQPAMTLRSKLIAVQQLQPGDCVGYGSSYVCEAEQRIGIVACGYADGYPRHAGSGTPVLVDGVRCSTVGRVSMDMIAVDLTPVSATGAEADIGSEVTLWGRGPGGAVLAVDEVAHAAATIGYELLCAVAPRVPMRAADPNGAAGGAPVTPIPQ